jgi:hypothetical protein
VVAPAQIIILLKMLKISKTYFSQREIFCEGKEKGIIWIFLEFYFISKRNPQT